MRLALIAVLISCCISCKNAREETVGQLAGRWKLQAALRNDTPTETLESLYMHFLSDSLVETNLSGESRQVSYSIDAQHNIVLQMPPALTLGIGTLSDSVLVLDTQISESQFNLQFSREKK